MVDNKSKDQTVDLRKGIVIFIILLAIIVGAGIYLYQQSSALNRQYDSIEKAF